MSREPLLAGTPSHLGLHEPGNRHSALLSVAWPALLRGRADDASYMNEELNKPVAFCGCLRSAHVLYLCDSSCFSELYWIAIDLRGARAI